MGLQIPSAVHRLSSLSASQAAALSVAVYGTLLIVRFASAMSSPLRSCIASRPSSTSKRFDWGSQQVLPTWFEPVGHRCRGTQDEAGHERRYDAGAGGRDHGKALQKRNDRHGQLECRELGTDADVLTGAERQPRHPMPARYLRRLEPVGVEARRVRPDVG
jgi:hypothetical protein